MAGSSRPPVRGLKTDRDCPHCGERQVLIAYRRFASLVLFCGACERSWTETDADAATAAPSQRRPTVVPAVSVSADDSRSASSARPRFRCDANLPCVLVVDDEPSIRTVLQRMLMIKGCCSIAVEDDTDAAAAAEEETFNAFVLDVHLRGGRSGLDLLRRLRLNGRAATAPMFVLTGQRDLSGQDETFLRDHHAHVFYKGESLLRLVEHIKAEITKTL